ncbi:hypothetical protein Fmac_004377 [Flemingia macrophylla]|uniref:Uncharacterized protein n=1 Tax=Flemingia macrophylla TaxID=520843 RepID=A0ABD1N4R6_9FABA
MKKEKMAGFPSQSGDLQQPAPNIAEKGNQTSSSIGNAHPSQVRYHFQFQIIFVTLNSFYIYFLNANSK